MRTALLALVLFLVAACTPPEPSVPQFGFEDGRRVVSIAGERAGLSTPRDLEFHPDRPNELWAVNRDYDGVLILTDPGTRDVVLDKRVDEFANHFMEEVSSIAFGDDNTFATCQESRNTYNGQAPGNDFMGPTLWPADLAFFAEIGRAASVTSPAVT